MKNAQLLTFKRENFCIQQNQKQRRHHVSISRFRLHLRKKNITSPCIRFEPLWDCRDNRCKYSGDNLIGLFFLDDLLLLKTTLWIKTFQALLMGIFSWVFFLFYYYNLLYNIVFFFFWRFMRMKNVWRYLMSGVHVLSTF